MPNDPFDLDDFDAAIEQELQTPAHAPNYFEGLNAPQLEAVQALDGPLLVLAGAGTGKTRVLTTRLGHILATGLASPWNILAVTFTNKAAKEMQERVTSVLGRPIEGMWIGTFHSICVKILRRHAELVGLKSNFTILDTDDQVRLLKQLVKADGLDDKRWPAKQLAALIDRWKNKALTPDRISEGDNYSYAEGQGRKYYEMYQARLKTLNAADFGDLLMLCIQLFQQNPDILAQYHSQFRYLLVDEYQDTNVAQYLWLRLLAQKNHNICCVGDDDQSIYGWRGAEVGNILRFSDDFPGAKVVRLEQNYRSTGHILAAASALITENEDRLEKTLWTDSGDGEKVEVRGVWDAPEEARYICDEIESLQIKKTPLNEVAILVRAGFQMREFEERLITLGLPYRVVGGPRFYERQEIRDALAYLRVIAQPDDDLAFERIVNVPKRGIGAASLQKVHNLARQMNCSMGYAVRDACAQGIVSGKAKTSLMRLMDDFDRWRALSHTIPHTELTEMVLDESGYTQMWQKDTTPQAEGRLENLKEMVSGMEDFDNLAGFLEHISLVMANDENAGTDKITLMTLHAAKGLEFDYVFLAGWEEGIFPSERSLSESGVKALEEERRLAYVGITRAKRKAFILFAGNRQVFGQWRSSIPSRFVDELPADHIDFESSQGIYGSGKSDNGYDDGWGSASDSFNSSYGAYQKSSYKSDSYSGGWKKAERMSKTDPRNRFIDVKPVKSKKKASKTISSYAIGERVFHTKFGYGTVEDVEGNKLLVA